jgi:large subunit ribosomal protein L7A
MPLNELSEGSRVAGINSVLRSLKSGRARKVFLSKEADPRLLKEAAALAEAQKIEVEWVADSLKLGRACAVSRKTAAAALLKEEKS